MSAKCRKYLTDTGDVILQNLKEGSQTFLFDQDMNLKDLWRHRGRLIGCLPGPRTVYAVREAEGFLAEIRSQNGKSMQLNLERNERPMVSVCEDGRTGKLVVVQRGWKDTSFMDIFSGVGKSKHQIIMQKEMCLESGLDNNHILYHSLMPLSHLVGISRNQAKPAGIKVRARFWWEFQICKNAARLLRTYLE